MRSIIYLLTFIALLFFGASTHGNDFQFSEGLTDSFGRLRVSSTRSLYESTSEYGLQTNVWETLLGTTNSTATHLPLESAISLAVGAGTNTADRVVRQSLFWPPYEPGKSHGALLTFALGTPAAGITRAVGMFDDSDGVFLEQDATNYWLCVRTKTSGTTNTTRVAREAWNIDRLADLDLSKANILLIDYQWLGVGRVRYGFDIDGKVRYAHQVVHAGQETGVYMSSGTLPVRYEIRKTGATTAAASMKQICSAVFKEGGDPQDRLFTFGAVNPSVRTVGTTFVPVLSLRAAPTLSGRTNHSAVRLLTMNLGIASGTAMWELRYNAGLAGAAFTNQPISSGVVFDTVATVATNGVVIAAGVVSSTVAGASTFDRFGPPSRFPITVNAAGTPYGTLTLAVKASTGTVDVVGAFNWGETQ